MWDVSEITTAREWRCALALAPKHDFYHTWDFHAISQNNGEGTPVLFKIYKHGAGLLVPLLDRDIPGTNHKDLTSVYGYPSPIVYGKISGSEITEMWDFLCCYLATIGYVSLFCRLHPVLSPEKIVQLHGCYCGPIVIIDLTLTEQAQVQQYRNAHKRNIKKLKKLGAECYSSKDKESLEFFMQNYESTMRSLRASAEYFFPEVYYQRLLMSNDFDARIYCCKYNGDIICSGIFIFCGDIVQYHLGGTNPKYYQLAPTKLMFEKVRIDACDECKKYFILGGGLGAAEDNLFRFKSGFSKTTKKFHVMKLILNKSVYNDILSFAGNDTSFFPKYRA